MKIIYNHCIIILTLKETQRKFWVEKSLSIFPYIFATQYRRAQIFQTMNFVISNNLSLKWQRYPNISLKALGIEYLIVWQRLQSIPLLASKAQIFQTINYVRSNNLTFNHQRFTPSGCKYIEIRKKCIYTGFFLFSCSFKFWIFYFYFEKLQLQIYIVKT